MRIKIIAVGTKMPSWVATGFTEYVKRMPPELPVQLIEIPMAKRGKNPDLDRAIKAEGNKVLEQIKANDFVIALEVGGAHLSTEKLAQKLASWQQDGRDICILIGGPDGNAEVCLKRADYKLSLSELTLPHPLVRIVLAEQFYRAWSILANHPYHRA